MLLIALLLTLAPFTAAAAGHQVSSPPATARQSVDDATLWREFEQWAATLEHVPFDQSKRLDIVYIEALVARGVPREEAAERFARINASRRGSVERERLYWEVVWKVDPSAPPDHPLLLMQEFVKGLTPGRALVPGMGNGRDAIYLAAHGWDVTGYDIADAAVVSARDFARKAGVSMKVLRASHDDFDFGTEQWDLIVNAANYMDPLDSRWPPRLWRALKPGGIIIWHAAGPAIANIEYASQVASAWKQFRVLRLEQPDGTGDDWRPNLPFIRLVLKKTP